MGNLGVMIVSSEGHIRVATSILNRIVIFTGILGFAMVLAGVGFGLVGDAGPS
jgi:hypothetical protein